MQRLWIVLFAVITAGTISCDNLDNEGNLPAECTQWQLDACDAFHACGKMQAVDDCNQNASALCSADYLPADPPEECPELTRNQLKACILTIEADCPTFEDLYDIPDCVTFMECFGWPM